MIKLRFSQNYISMKMIRILLAMRNAWARGEKTMMITPRQCRIVGREIPEMVVYDEAHHVSDLDWKLIEELVNGGQK